ncbi:helix-turn-helix transcriptional regulator [Martelella sp. AMO21009]
MRSRNVTNINNLSLASDAKLCYKANPAFVVFNEHNRRRCLINCLYEVSSILSSNFPRKIREVANVIIKQRVMNMNDVLEMPRNPHELLTLDKVAHEFGFARSTVYRLVSAGELPPFFKIGKTNFVRRSTLERWISEREQQAMALAA